MDMIGSQIVDGVLASPVRDGITYARSQCRFFRDDGSLEIVTCRLGSDWGQSGEAAPVRAQPILVQ